MTVAVVFDTQYLVDGDPNEPGNTGFFSDPNSFTFENDEKDFGLLQDLVAFLVGESAADQENIQLVLHMGDAIFAGDGGGVPCTGNYKWPLEPSCVVPQSNGSEVCVDAATGDWIHEPRDADDGTPCGCQWRRRIRVQWERFSRTWNALDGVVPYVLVQGNHDNTGRLPTDAAHPAELWEKREVEDGFYQYYGAPKSIRDALRPAAGAEPTGPSAGELVSSYAQSRARIEPDGEPGKARRGTSTAWRFDLGARAVGVLGLTWSWAWPDLAEPQEPIASLPAPEVEDLEWANRMVSGPLAGLPLIVLSHQHLRGGRPDERNELPDQFWPSWIHLVRDTSQTFWAPEGHFSSPTTASLAFRDAESPPQAPAPGDFVLWNRSAGDGHQTTRAANNRCDEPFRSVRVGSAQLFLVRFFFKGDTSVPSDPDEVEVIRVDPTLDAARPVSFDRDHTSGRWGAVMCEPFSISYQDRDQDGVTDASDNCPLIPNPPGSGGTQADHDSDGIGDACRCDLNDDGRVDAGDVAIARQLADGSNTDASLRARADLAPHPGPQDGAVNLADVQLVLRAAAAGACPEYSAE